MKFREWAKGKSGRSAELALLLDITPTVVSNWVTGKKAIPAEYCRDIVTWTDGAVTVQELRPNDWFKYWPELAVPPVDGAGVAAENVAQEGA